MHIIKNISPSKCLKSYSILFYISAKSISVPLPFLSILKKHFLTPKGNKSESSVIITLALLDKYKNANYASAS
jgi:hypothetical protein